ncbi:hypothetical protein FRC00_011624 [Tulasnella sp. 408]|nr:hypothetical protein FRC00_011624 [Tulasnella sp. 408]
MDPFQWLGFLLDSSIKLKKFKALVYTAGGSVQRVWNRFVASVLDVQLSLESLELLFDNGNPVFELERMDKWAPKLRILSVSPVGGLKALLCKKRLIETVVIRSIPARYISYLCAKELKNADTIKEIIYRGPVEDGLVSFPELFGAMPASLRIFRGELWLRFSTEDFFLQVSLPVFGFIVTDMTILIESVFGIERKPQELLTAFALTHYLTEFDIGDSSRSLMGFFSVGEADIFHTDLESYEDAYLGDRATCSLKNITTRMDSVQLPAHSNWPRVGLHLIPDDVIIYILDFFESTTLAAMTLANRHLHELATPALYRHITIPEKEGGNSEHRQSAARLLRTLSRRPSLTIFVQHLENAPPQIPLHALKSIWTDHADLSDSNPRSAEQDAHAHSNLQHVAVDVMKSCVNLRSLHVAGTVSTLQVLDRPQWLSFLLDSSIRLKRFKILTYPEGPLTGRIWQDFVASILDVQLSLEYLDINQCSNKNPPFEEEIMEGWAPKLRILVGRHVGGLRPLLSNKRSIETVVVRSILRSDISFLCGDQLRSTDNIKEVIYQGPEAVEPNNFPVLFSAMPASLRIFRVEIWLDIGTEEIFFQLINMVTLTESVFNVNRQPQLLLHALIFTPDLTELDIADSSYSISGLLRIAGADIFQTDSAWHEEECARDQATWLARYSGICPKLQSLTFPDGKRWIRVENKWIPRDRYSWSGYVG